MNRIDTCDACGRQIVWLEHLTTKNKAPIEYAPHVEGNVIPLDRDGDWVPIVHAVSYRIRGKNEDWKIDDEPLFMNHFATCKDAPRFARKARGAA